MEFIRYFGLFFSFGIPVGVIIGMIVMLIHDRRKAKKRDKRCHQVIRNWYDLKVSE